MASEVVTLINFFLLDFLMLSYVMYMSGILAGYINHFTLQKKNRLDLVPCDIPLVGGGICMSKGPKRLILLSLRISIVVAVFVCNYGLEGRSEARMSETVDTVRVPLRASTSVHSDLDLQLTRAIELRQRCLDTDQSNSIAFKFGSVIGDKCYPKLSQHVYIHRMSVDLEQVPAPLQNCVSHPLCNISHTIYKCDNGEAFCHGVPHDHDCKLPPGLEKLPGPNPNDCASVFYRSDGEYAWVCEKGFASPGILPVSGCRGIAAKREDLRYWTEIYFFKGTSIMESLFKSAYGDEKNETVRLPVGENPITIVTLWWLVPVIWILTVAVAVTYVKIRMIMTKAVLIVHDERGLARLLGRQIEKTRSWEQEPEEGLLKLRGEQYTVCVSIHEDVRKRALTEQSRALPFSAPRHIPLIVGQECRCVRNEDAIVDFT